MTSIFDLNKYVELNIMMSPVHIFTLIIFFILLGSLYYWQNRSFMKQTTRWLLVSSLAISELSLIIWSIVVGQWDIRYNLPLQLCTISLYLCIYMLVTKNKTIFEVVYFFGLAGALQALITPDLFYTFPHFRFLHFFIAHISIILAIFYMVWVEKYMITFTSFIKSFFLLNGFAFIAFWTNQLTGANYMFLARKPANPSILDLLGPYPWYILSLEAIALLSFFLLYLPFMWKRNR